MRGKGNPVGVLVVDDEVDMRTLVRIVIDVANHGLSVVGEAQDGREALAMWHDPDGPPADVVVLDNRMPGPSGLEVAGSILSQRPDQLIVLFSAFLTDDIRRAAADIGIAACITKDQLHDLPEVIWSLQPDAA